MLYASGQLVQSRKLLSQCNLVQSLGCLPSQGLPVGEADDPGLVVAVIVHGATQEHRVRHRSPNLVLHRSL